jgi:hypothetical protein
MLVACRLTTAAVFEVIAETMPVGSAATEPQIHAS